MTCTMPIRTILKMGDERLLRVSDPVTAFDTPELHALLQDLRDTMKAANGAGIAAPQIGVNLQVVIFGSGQINPRYPQYEPIPPTVLINPVITVLDPSEDEGWEGCLSVPGMRGIVPRPRRVRYQGLGLNRASGTCMRWGLTQMETRRELSADRPQFVNDMDSNVLNS